MEVETDGVCVLLPFEGAGLSVGVEWDSIGALLPKVNILLSEGASSSEVA